MRTLEVRHNRNFPKYFSVLTANKVVDGGSGRSVVCC